MVTIRKNDCYGIYDPYPAAAAAELPLPGAGWHEAQARRRGRHRHGGAGRSGVAELLYGVRVFFRRARRRGDVPHARAVEHGMAADQPDAAYRHGHPARPDFGDDARGDFDRLADGARLLAGLHEGRAGVSALLCLPVVVYDEHDGACGGDQYFPDVPVLGIGGRQLLPAHRFLLHEKGGRRGLEEGVYRDALRRPGVPRRHPLLRVLRRDVLLYAGGAAAGRRR